MPAILPSCSAKTCRAASRSLNGTTRTRSANACGMPIACAHRDRMLARAHVVGVGRDREHQRVVVAVVGALDLHEHVAPGVRAHQAAGLERRLGAGVAEAPQRKPEPIGQVLADHVEVLRGLREVRAALGLALDRLDDLRMRVARHHRAVAQMEVDVLVLVDVPDAVALAAVDVDRVRAASPASSRRRLRRRSGRRSRGRRSMPLRVGSSVASSRSIRLSIRSRSNSTRAAMVIHLLRGTGAAAREDDRIERRFKLWNR